MFGIGRKTKIKPGLICVPALEQGRYNQFNFCLSHLRKPKGTITDWMIGDDKAWNINQSIKRAIEEGFDWVWILDDSCSFDPQFLFRLLKNYKSVVFPFLLERIQPYRPTLKQPSDNGYMQFGMEHFNSKTGLLEISGLCLDISGMLIKTSVLKKLNGPWMENVNNVVNDYGLNFCKKLTDNKIGYWLDLDNPMGRITHTQVLPHRNEQGQYAAIYLSFSDLMYQENLP
jgi:hypothetical protein